MALALERRDLAAAHRLAALLRASGHPLGPLFTRRRSCSTAARTRRRGGPRRRARSRSPRAGSGHGSSGRWRRAPRPPSRSCSTVRASRSRRARRTARCSRSRARNGSPARCSRACARSACAPAVGPALRLGLDLELSRIALEALGERQGSIVLVDPRSGEVRAAVTDALTARTEPAAAFEQRREPASIAKLITTAAAYRAGHDADALIGRMTCTGVERYGGQPLWCPWPTGPLAGLDQALAVSCNLAFANLAMRVGRERLVEEYRRWGFDAAPPELLDAAGRVETAAGAAAAARRPGDRPRAHGRHAAARRAAGGRGREPGTPRGAAARVRGAAARSASRTRPTRCGRRAR